VPSTRHQATLLSPLAQVHICPSPGSQTIPTSSAPVPSLHPKYKPAGAASNRHSNLRSNQADMALMLGGVGRHGK
jgi:hypothetical protein